MTKCGLRAARSPRLDTMHQRTHENWRANGWRKYGDCEFGWLIQENVRRFSYNHKSKISHLQCMTYSNSPVVALVQNLMRWRDARLSMHPHTTPLRDLCDTASNHAANPHTGWNFFIKLAVDFFYSVFNMDILLKTVVECRFYNCISSTNTPL